MRVITYKNIMCLLLFILTVNTLSAQNFEEVFKKVNNYYLQADTYNIESTFSLYRGYTGNIVTESYKGSMYKKNDFVGMAALGSEVITFSGAQIILNDTHKTIRYINSNTIKTSLIDVDQILKFYDQTATKEVENTIVYEFLLKKKDSNIPYSKLIFHINKKDFSLIKQEFFFGSKLPFKNKEGLSENDFGRMEIIYTSKAKPFKKNIKIEDYLMVNSEDKLSLSKAYAGYKLIDQTPYN